MSELLCVRLQEVGFVSEAAVEVLVSDVCGVYQVQVRCRPTNGTGYWSDWTQTVHSTTLNRSGKVGLRYQL